jgi:hypothetical protein
MLLGKVNQPSLQLGPPPPEPSPLSGEELPRRLELPRRRMLKRPLELARARRQVNDRPIVNRRVVAHSSAPNLPPYV